MLISRLPERIQATGDSAKVQGKLVVSLGGSPTAIETTWVFGLISARVKPHTNTPALSVQAVDLSHCVAVETGEGGHGGAGEKQPSGSQRGAGEPRIHRGLEGCFYRCTRWRTIGAFGRRREALIDGSDPSGGGPTAHRFASSFAGWGIGKPTFVVRCNSICSPFSVPANVLFPAVKET